MRISSANLGLSGTGIPTVINVNNDDHGSYAGDSIDDVWQVRYFGTNNPLVSPTKDAEGTGLRGPNSVIARIFSSRMRHPVYQPHGHPPSF